MAKIYRVSFIVTVCTLVMLSSEAFCERQIMSSKETLQGIKSFYVIVEAIDPKIKSDELFHKQIVNDVELKLMMADIDLVHKTVISEDTTFLCVSASIMKTKLARYIYTIRVIVKQPVYLCRNEKIVCDASTWECTGLGVTSDIRDIRNMIKSKIDDFIIDYLSVNPKGDDKEL